MSWITLVGPVTGVLGLLVVLVSNINSRRSQAASERIDSSRLGHDDLVSALEERRDQVASLKAELALERSERARERVDLTARLDAAQQRITQLLIERETR